MQARGIVIRAGKYLGAESGRSGITTFARPAFPQLKMAQRHSLVGRKHVRRSRWLLGGRTYGLLLEGIENMKCEIDETGLMTVSAETPLEAFALRTWAGAASIPVTDESRNEIQYWRGSRLIVVGNLTNTK